MLEHMVARGIKAALTSFKYCFFMIEVIIIPMAMGKNTSARTPTTYARYKRHRERFSRFYLFDSVQSTQIGPAISNKQPMTCGVPQGSVLGPSLSFYVNDIHKSSFE